MTNIPRDAGFYYPSEHAVIRKRDRNVRWEYVSETIETGDIKTQEGDETCTFVNYIREKGRLLYVSVNVECGEILTIAWHTND